MLFFHFLCFSYSFTSNASCSLLLSSPFSYLYRAFLDRRPHQARTHRSRGRKKLPVTKLGSWVGKKGFLKRERVIKAHADDTLFSLQTLSSPLPSSLFLKAADTQTPIFFSGGGRKKRKNKCSSSSSSVGSWLAVQVRR